MKFKDLPVEVQVIAANMLKDLYIFDQQDVNEERAKNLSKAFVALYQDTATVSSDITPETRKLIKDSMGVYDDHLSVSESENKTTSESTKYITNFWEKVKNLSLATYAPVKASDEDERIQDMHKEAISTLRDLYFNEIDRQVKEAKNQRGLCNDTERLPLPKVERDLPD